MNRFKKKNDPNYEYRYAFEEEYPKRTILSLSEEFAAMYGHPVKVSYYFFKAYFTLQNNLFNRRYIIARSNFIFYYKRYKNKKKNVTDERTKTQT